MFSNFFSWKNPYLPLGFALRCIPAATVPLRIAGRSKGWLCSRVMLWVFAILVYLVDFEDLTRAYPAFANQSRVRLHSRLRKSMEDDIYKAVLGLHWMIMKLELVFYYCNFSVWWEAPIWALETPLAINSGVVKTFF